MGANFKLRWLATSRGDGMLTTDLLGFTLVELIGAIAIVGILAAIAAPGWLGLMQRQRLDKARGEIFQGLQAAKSNATRDKITWQMSLRENNSNNRVEWAIHPASSSECIPATVLNNAAYWNALERGVRLDSETNIKHLSMGCWRVLFNHHGCPVYNPNDECGSTSLQALGRITLQPANGGKLKRCVIISTVIGAMRSAQNQRTSDGGKYCY